MFEETPDLISDVEELQDQSSELIKRVQEAVNFLVKAIKINCIYPPDNPIPREFRNNLFKKLTEFLEENEELKLGVDQSGLLFQDKLILKEEKKDEGVAFALYRDGIRELSFHKEIEQEELFSFLEAITSCLKSSLPEDDLVTLFWEKDLPHIKFSAVDEFLTEDINDLPLPAGSKDLKQLYYSEIDLKESRGIEMELPARIQVERFLRDLDLVPQQELNELKFLLEKDKSFEPLKELFLILKEVLSGDKEFSDFADTILLLEKLLDSLVSQQDFCLASEVLVLLKNLEETESEGGQTRRAERIREALNRAGDKERIKILTQILNQNPKLDLFSARKYLSLLSRNTIPHLVDMLGELENFAARSMVCTVLENWGEKSIELLSKGVYDRRWYVVRNIVGVLGRIGSPQAIPFLKKTIGHEDLRVRKQTLEALSRIKGEEVTSILLGILEDSEEKLRVRAARFLSERSSQGAFEFISNLVSRKDFRDKSQEEKKILLESLARIGKDKAVELLKKLILKRAWFKREKQKESSYLALKALASVNTSLSLEALKVLSSSRSRKIRQQANLLIGKSHTLQKTADSRPVETEKESEA
ncbi:MAG TPA: HEAT repeat domain-containing protein [Terriglobales bacterium]|nr:HEAT repeat domain-containing protein [Terriglobales bacterium]